MRTNQQRVNNIMSKYTVYREKSRRLLTSLVACCLCVVLGGGVAIAIISALDNQIVYSQQMDYQAFFNPYVSNNSAVISSSLEQQLSEEDAKTKYSVLIRVDNIEQGHSDVFSRSITHREQTITFAQLTERTEYLKQQFDYYNNAETYDRSKVLSASEELKELSIIRLRLCADAMQNELAWLKTIGFTGVKEYARNRNTIYTPYVSAVGNKNAIKRLSEGQCGYVCLLALPTDKTDDEFELKDYYGSYSYGEITRFTFYSSYLPYGSDFDTVITLTANSMSIISDTRCHEYTNMVFNEQPISADNNYGWLLTSMPMTGMDSVDDIYAIISRGKLYLISADCVYYDASKGETAAQKTPTYSSYAFALYLCDGKMYLSLYSHLICFVKTAQ